MFIKKVNTTAVCMISSKANEKFERDSNSQVNFNLEIPRNSNLTRDNEFSLNTLQWQNKVKL